MPHSATVQTPIVIKAALNTVPSSSDGGSGETPDRGTETVLHCPLNGTQKREEG